MIWDLTPVLTRLRRDAVKPVVVGRDAVLDATERKYNVRFGAGWLERVDVLVRDGGKHVGAYVDAYVVRDGLPTPDFEMRFKTLYDFGFTRDKANPGLTRYDPDAGVYAVDMSFAPPHPMLQPYTVNVEYPSREAVAGDPVAEGAWGSPVTVKLRVFAWEVDHVAFLDALRKLVVR